MDWIVHGCADGQKQESQHRPLGHADALPLVEMRALDGRHGSFDGHTGIQSLIHSQADSQEKIDRHALIAQKCLIQVEGDLCRDEDPELQDEYSRCEKSGDR